MEITEVRVRLIPNRGSGDRLRAFCSVTFDGDFVIRDLKVIEGVNGVFVAMPSRKLADRCPRCKAKNHLRARFCNECGAKLNRERIRKDAEGRPKYHADVAHPINSGCRERIEKAVREAYEMEKEKAKAPDYKPVAFDDDEFSDTDYDDLIADLKREAAKRRTDRADSESTVPPEAREEIPERSESEPEPDHSRRNGGPDDSGRDRPREDRGRRERFQGRRDERREDRPPPPPPPPPPAPSAPPRPSSEKLDAGSDSDFGTGIFE